MDYQLIINDLQLQQFCLQAAQYKFVAVDTEFIRTRSYYPQLGLIQLYTGSELALIDPIKIEQWSPLVDLMINPQVTKLLHACSEDLDVFMHHFGILPEPMIDTQIVAAFIGHPLSSGFASLVEHYLSVTLDKSESRTDWLARPLTAKQCQYAASDVYYLLPLAEKMLDQAEKSPWMMAIHQETDTLIQRKLALPNPKLVYLNISNSWQLTKRHLYCLQLLAQWRFDYARQRDIALNFVVREESLWKIAQQLPHSMAELQELGLKPTEIRLHGKTLLGYVNQALASHEGDWPEPIIRVIDAPGYKHNVKQIKEVINLVVDQSQLKPELIASRRQIDQFLKWRWLNIGDKPELITGWRGELLADSLNRLK